MNIRITNALAVLSLACLASAQIPQTMSLTTLQPSYRIGQTAFFTIKGTPGRAAYLLVGTVRKDTLVPGFGVFCVDPFAATSKLIGVGALPKSGEFTLCDPIPCMKSLTNIRLFMQAVELDFITGKAAKSNCATVLSVDGDCAGRCISLQQLGVQTIIKGVTATTSDVSISFYKKLDKKDFFGKLDLKIDWSNPPALPLSNQDNSITLTYLEKNGSDLTIQICVSGAGLKNEKLGPQISPSIILDGAETISNVHTSCSQPIDVGTVWGAYTVTKLINK